MTSPRDAIAGLSEITRICNSGEHDARYAASKMPGHSMQHNVEVLRETFKLIREKDAEAATQLGSLLKERDALQADLQVKDQAIADMAHTIYELQQERNMLERSVEAFEAEAANTDALQARVKELEQERNVQMLRALKATDRATRLQQERDEAYERAAKVAESTYGGKAHTYASENAEVYWAQDDACARIAAAIRRLAGPEKEKKE